MQDKVARVRGRTTAQQEFAASWEEARVGQLELKLTLAEEKLEFQLEQLARDTDTELRVHAELETYFETALQVRFRELNKYKCV